MTLGFLLDTNVLAEPLKPSPNPSVLGRLEEHDGACATAAPVWHELVYGAARLAASKRREVIEAYLERVVGPSIPVLAYDAAAAAWHGRERGRLAALGRTPPFVDGQIAAVAATNGLVLVTRNTADYAHFDGLRVANWFG